MDQPIKPFVVSINETGRLCGRGRTAVYEMIAAGQLEAIKDGHRTLVTLESIERRIANLPRVRSDARA